MKEAEKEAERIIENCENYLKNKIGTSIVKHYKGFIILAQSVADLNSKAGKIRRGQTFGFYTLKQVKQAIENK